MNTRFLSIALAAAALTVAAGTAHAQALSVGDAGAKTFKFNDKVGDNQFVWNSSAPLEKIRGTAEGIGGTLTIDPKNISAIRGTITTQVSTFKSGNSVRDGHLRGSDWLDAANHPTISFAITGVSGVRVSGNTATGTATGRFTMHGVTKTISVPFKLTYVEASSATAKRAPGDLVMISADFAVRLADFNVAGAKGVVGSKVGETINITANLYLNSGS